jgi:hypothetical protein
MNVLNFRSVQIFTGAALPSLWGGLGWGFLFLLCGCITEYRATGIDELSDILVVEGVITDDESVITLSRSVFLTEETSQVPVDNAKVYLECDDGTLFHSEPPNRDYWLVRYVIKNGQLDLNRKYQLKIEIGEHKYSSDFSHPINTPEIDSVFWVKRGRGQPVMIYVSTRVPDNKILYYRWSYREDWEIHSELQMEDYPYYCWNKENSRDILIGSAERTIFGQMTGKITEMPPTSRRLSVLYRIDVKQNAISKRAYDYFANIKKNAEQTGSIFAPVPSELRGNIVCATDPDRPVIGYVDVSMTTQKRRYIKRSDNVYELPHWECDLIPGDSLMVEGEIPSTYVQFVPSDPTMLDPLLENMYVHIKCVDCTQHGTELKPDDWLSP